MIEPYEMEHQPTEEELCWLNDNIDSSFWLIEERLYGINDTDDVWNIVFGEIETTTFIIFQEKSDAVAFKLFIL